MIERWKGMFHWLIDELPPPHSYHSLTLSKWVRFDRSNIVHLPLLFLIVSRLARTYNLMWKIWNTIRRYLFRFSPGSIEGIVSFLVAFVRPNSSWIAITTNKNHIFYTKLPITTSAMEPTAFIRCSFYRIKGNYVNWSFLSEFGNTIECDGCPIEHRENPNCHAQNIKIAMGN